MPALESLIKLAQTGLLSDPTRHVEYLVFDLTKTPSADTLAEAMSMIANALKSIGQKDTTADLSITSGFSKKAWSALFNDQSMPRELHDFIEMRDGPRHFPATQGDVFFMIKSSRLDLNFQAAKYLKEKFGPFADLRSDVQGFKYLDDRDMIDFVDGTENPKADARMKAVLIDDDNDFLGGSYLILQQYRDRLQRWNSLKTEEQEAVIGRTKFDDIELDASIKKPSAHNEKSKVFDAAGNEIKMLRQNRAWGNAKDHGTMFVGFAKSPQIIETSLKQMITADDNGDYDKLLDFVDAMTGEIYFIPPQSFLDKYS